VSTLAQAGQASEFRPACPASKSRHTRPQKVNKPNAKRKWFLDKSQEIKKNFKIYPRNVKLNYTPIGSFGILNKSFVQTQTKKRL
jgi:hypothetical protein